ncbi:phage holin family protein [Pseudogracilibacillus auburnensis]|uniref:phage holin family protein n=1 Tax=Pseudogracilibacillus auburnensis TaxID=1494959 RepID=UPI001A9573E9|nr:phage holin family protein [Pseudogracilibacillus auburnensis]MBO1003165.1 phage holin family protein [Pseudogracilibacillus auburnensis]
MDMINFLQGLTENKDYYIIALLSVILVASTIDFLFGWINAKFNKNVEFDSGKALYGIIKKMMYFVALALFMVVAFLIVPVAIAYTAITTLFIGYLISEGNSILSHLELTEDGKKGELFRSFISRILNGDKSSE